MGWDLLWLGWGECLLHLEQMLFQGGEWGGGCGVEWWPPKREVHILAPGTCAWELNWREGLCRWTEGSRDEKSIFNSPGTLIPRTGVLGGDGWVGNTRKEAEIGVMWPQRLRNPRSYKGQGSKAPPEPLEDAQLCRHWDLRLLATGSARGRAGASAPKHVAVLYDKMLRKCHPEAGSRPAGR